MNNGDAELHARLNSNLCNYYSRATNKIAKRST